MIQVKQFMLMLLENGANSVLLSMKTGTQPETSDFENALQRDVYIH